MNDEKQGEYGFLPREFKLLDALAQGILSDRGLSEHLNITEKTAGTYMMNLRDKLEDHFQERWSREQVSAWWKEEKTSANK